MPDEAPWIRLTSLVTDSASVLPLVLSAVQTPAAYFAEHASALADRGIDDADDVTGVVALIDALDELGEVAYADWKEQPEEVVAMLAGLPLIRASQVALEDLLAAEGEVEQVAKAANQILASAGLSIIQIDEGSDAYAMVAVPTERLADLIAAGAAAEDSITTFR